MDVRLPDGTILTNVPEGTTREDIEARLGAKLEPIQDPLTAETNKAAMQAIGAAVPEPVKQAAGKVAGVAQAGFQALPESVQSAARSTGNFLLDALEQLQRPFQSVAVAAKETRQIQGETQPQSFDPTKSLEEQMMPSSFTKEGSARIKAAAKRGFNLQEKASTQELLSPEYRKANPVKAATIGFLGDALTDPLNAVGSAPFKIVKETINAFPGATSTATRLADNEVFRAINITTGDTDKARQLYNQFRYTRDKAKNEGVRAAKEVNKQIKILSKQTGIPADELRVKIIQDIETGELSDAQIGAIEQNIVARNRALLEEQKAAGVDVGDLGENYMPHVLTKEADEILKSQDKKNFFGTRPSAKSPSAIAREIEGTVQEINAKNLYGANKFFSDDPALLVGVAEFRAANAIAGKRFLNSVQELGVPEKSAPTSFVTIPEVPGVRFAPEVAKQAKRYYQVLTDQNELSKVLKVYDGALNWWKMWSLGVRPAYHTKNAVGNVWNAYLGGLQNPQRYGDAGIFQYKLAKNDMTGTVMGKPMSELYEAMATRGVFGEGQYGGDFTRRLEQELAPARAIDILNPGTQNLALRAGFKVGQTVEDNARIALFLDQVKKGSSYDQAGKHVQKYLFDYGDVSPFEQSTIKRIMPFYTWSRKNIPLQLEAIVAHPERVNKLGLGISNIEQAAGVQPPDPTEVPQYITDSGPVYVGKGEQTVQAVTLNNLIPFMDLGIFTKFLNTKTQPEGPAKGLDPRLGSILSGASPFIKEPIEQLANYDTFRNKAIQEYEGQQSDMLGITMPTRLAKTLSNIVVISEIDRLNPAGIFGTQTVDPVTGNVTKTPSIFGEERGARVDLPEEQRQAQALTGVRVYDIVLGDAEARTYNKLKADINTLKGYVTRAARKENTRDTDNAIKAIDKMLAEMDRIEAEKKARKEKKGQ
jgi:hypothetical protein